MGKQSPPPAHVILSDRSVSVGSRRTCICPFPPRRLDKKLEEAVGRPYRILITVGLITEISIQVRELLHAHFTKSDVIQTAIWFLLAPLLVINQLGELSSRMDERPPRRI
ncbi:MAG: hypothetical protein ACRD2D_05940 [Terriglobales bacterium]